MEATKHAPLLRNPLLDAPPRADKTSRRRRRVVTILCSVIALASVVAIILVRNQREEAWSSKEKTETSSFRGRSSVPRGVYEGVSAKSNVVSENLSYNWTNAMFSWQRTAYHFQPQRNWMNDPDGPLYHMGWYHLFYQYNPDSAVWGNITWGHAVSRDLIHWLYLPIAMVPDRPFDINGVWTGSATLLPDGKIIILYTGDTNKKVQVQNLAYPANLSDPLLLDWVKYARNPVLVPPTNIGPKDFRDPSTAWIGLDGRWRVTIGAKINKTGFSLVYTTTDFIHFKKNAHHLHSVPGTGMWECVDFYPVSINGSKGLPTSVNGPGVKHVLKASIDDTKVDHYALGTYFVENDTWVPDNPKEDVGIGLRVDCGRYYASKSFYDPVKERRVLWAWINETDTEKDNLKKGWASVQTIPREVTFDKKTGTNILQWPVEEIESLRLRGSEFEGIVLKPGSVLPLNISSATQLDIIAEFEIEPLGSEEIDEKSLGCGGGAIDRSALGPFGLLTIADDTLSELTPIFFRLSNSSHQNSTTFFCADETRSSKAPEVKKTVYGAEVPVLSDEKLSMRILVSKNSNTNCSLNHLASGENLSLPKTKSSSFLDLCVSSLHRGHVNLLPQRVDHSIIESFGQEGRRVITSRVYPTEAIYGAARLFLFNNATAINIKASLKIWELNSAFIRPFPFDQSL